LHSTALPRHHPIPTRRSSDLEADSPDSEPEPDPAPEGLVGGSGTGYTIEVTDDWVELDLQAEDLAQAAEDAGFTENPELARDARSEEHTSELQSRENLVCRLL